jgi:DNA repair protein RecN (Recombination protein N)
MLRALRVSDLAIIDEIELVLEPGFNVITGETGAGKSILLQALDIALGGRPDADLVRTGADEAVVEALFVDVPASVLELVSAAGIRCDAGAEVLVRRVIGRGGRTRAYVNGALGSLALLRELAQHLLRVYGQDEHQALRRVESHRELLDAAASLQAELEEMRARFTAMSGARQALEERRTAQRAANERLDLIRFQHDELERAALVPGEEAELQSERTRLAYADRLGSLAGTAEAATYSGEASAVDTLGRALGSLREAERLDPDLAPTRTLVETALAELEEAGAELGRYLRALAPDPARLETVERRLADLSRLQKKYAGTVEDLIRKREELGGELAMVEDAERGLAALTTAAEDAERRESEWAARLGTARRRAAGKLERSMAMELRQLALEGARFAVRFADGDGRTLGPSGSDEVEFYLTANPGEEARPLARVASGGELSRIMLALKTLMAGERDGAALIFDEVDTGIGGRVAEVVGCKLRELGRRRQVLTVTHLPVIAAFAEHHVAVTKRTVRGRTVSAASPLSDSERVDELARMLGGARRTREAREHAEELLRTGRGGRRPAA